MRLPGELGQADGYRLPVGTLVEGAVVEIQRHVGLPAALCESSEALQRGGMLRRRSESSLVGALRRVRIARGQRDRLPSEPFGGVAFVVWAPGTDPLHVLATTGSVTVGALLRDGVSLVVLPEAPTSVDVVDYNGVRTVVSG